LVDLAAGVGVVDAGAVAHRIVAIGGSARGVGDALEPVEAVVGVVGGGGRAALGDRDPGAIARRVVLVGQTGAIGPGLADETVPCVVGDGGGPSSISWKAWLDKFKPSGHTG
jgi:hypothetical protein